MSKGYDDHQARQMSLSAFGKDLARRSKSTCELSGASGVPLHIYEIPPVREPDFERCLFLSEAVIDQLQQPKRIEANEWRLLNELIWSEIPAVQLMAARLLIFLAQKHAWAQESLEQAYLDQAIIDLAEEAPLEAK